MKATGLVLMQTTLDSRPKAEVLAEGVIAAGLAACAQISGPVTSIYRWQGAMHKEREYIVLMKTLQARQTALADYIAARHPYSTPEIVAVPVVFANQAYFDWALQACSD